MIRTLLLSNSTMPGTSFLSWPQPRVKAFLGVVKKPLIFIPYAAVTIPLDEYTGKVREVFETMGYRVPQGGRFDL